MTDTQLYLAIGVPIVFNFAITLTLFLLINGNINSRIDAINHRFDAIDRRFDDMRDLWRSELHRVEGVLDARLKHIEEERQRP